MLKKPSIYYLFMIIPSQIEKIMELNNLAKEGVKKYKKRRYVYNSIKKMLSNKVFIGIAGLRGTGKTVLLRQLSLELQDSVYISLDALEHEIGLFELVNELNKNYGVKHVLLDEIHNYQNWQQEIKKIFDFLETKIVFTSSAAIDIVRSKYDLSRRVMIINIAPFSFREYLYFKKDIELDGISLDEVLGNYKELYKKIYLYESDFMDFCK